MVLEIKELENEFMLSGQLTKFTIGKFKESFLKELQSKDLIVLNIKELEQIDREGVNAIARLHNYSLQYGKKLSIVGLGCKELYQHMNSEDAA